MRAAVGGAHSSLCESCSAAESKRTQGCIGSTATITPFLAGAGKRRHTVLHLFGISGFALFFMAALRPCAMPLSTRN
jgi:hypothetical protein